ncbi:uncharacterized protein [Diadema antillarum]|uniref:uncharacterized protein n=1 Tax=Diadema antillarum TaxID=105358 RepID=UPI003A894D1A
MKPQVMAVSSTAGDIELGKHANGDLLSTADETAFKRELSDSSGSETSSSRSREPGVSKHHRKKLKWMTAQVNGISDKRPPSRCLSNKDGHPSVRSGASPSPNLTHIPADPRKWTADHVGSWLDALAVKYTIAVDKSNFHMNGRALCLMNREGFLRRAPDKGAILHEDFRSRLRRYLTACRRRVRTTFDNSAKSLPPNVPHYPPPGVPGMHPLHRVPPVPHVRPGMLAPWNVPFSAIRSKPSTDHNAQVTFSAHSLAPRTAPSAPSAPSANSMAHASSSIQNSDSHRQSTATASALHFQASHGATASIGTATSAGMGSRAMSSSTSFSSSTGAPSLLPSDHLLCVPASAVGSLISHPHAPLQVPRMATPSQSGDVSSTCPRSVASSAARGDLSTPHYLYHRGAFPFVYPPPYYHFVPVYRHMKVFGHFQPLTYGLPSAHVPNATQTPAKGPLSTASHAPSHSRATSLDTSVTASSSSQSEAVDLSMSSAGHRNSQDSSCGSEETESRRKRIKTEPCSP